MKHPTNRGRSPISQPDGLNKMLLQQVPAPWVWEGFYLFFCWSQLPILDLGRKAISKDGSVDVHKSAQLQLSGGRASVSQETQRAACKLTEDAFRTFLQLQIFTQFSPPLPTLLPQMSWSHELRILIASHSNDCKNLRLWDWDFPNLELLRSQYVSVHCSSNDMHENPVKSFQFIWLIWCWWLGPDSSLIKTKWMILIDSKCQLSGLSWVRVFRNE